MTSLRHFLGRVRRSFVPGYLPPGRSATSIARSRLAEYCTGDGVDLGFGGDPIHDRAVRVDLAQQYTMVGTHPVQLHGDAAHLVWFRDGVLDFVYSSHLLEDFEDTGAVLREWLRVLKPGGRLVLLCPDEQAYQRHCARTRQQPNPHHVHGDFSLAFVQRILDAIGGVRTVHSAALVDHYSWELVAEKLPH